MHCKLMNYLILKKFTIRDWFKIVLFLIFTSLVQQLTFVNILWVNVY